MLFVDLDGLKMINDKFGHRRRCGADPGRRAMLSGAPRTNDCVARLGGDEFGILLDHADEASALETAERLVDSIAWRGLHLRGHADAAVGRDRRDADREGRYARHGPGPRRQGDVPSESRGLALRWARDAAQRSLEIIAVA